MLGRGFHTLQGPAVAVDGHRAAQPVEGAAAHGMERDDIERVALANGLDRLQSEEVMALAATADGVDIFRAGDVDDVVIEADALHAVDQIDECGFLHAGHLGAKHVLQPAVRGFEEHLRGGLHHHQVALAQDAVEEAEVVLLKAVVGQGFAEVAAVDGEDHLVVDAVFIRVQRIGIVSLAMRQQAVDDAVGGVFSGFHSHLVELEGGGLQGDVAFRLTRLYLKGLRRISDGGEGNFGNRFVSGDLVFAVDVADDALQPFVDDHIDKGQGLMVFGVRDFSAEGMALRPQTCCGQAKEKKGEKRQDMRAICRHSWVSIR